MVVALLRLLLVRLLPTRQVTEQPQLLLSLVVALRAVLSPARRLHLSSPPQVALILASAPVLVLVQLVLQVQIQLQIHSVLAVV